MGDPLRCLVLAGRSGAGKTTLAHALEQHLGWPVTSFGDAVRRRAEADGYPGACRAKLMEIGTNWVAADAPGLCRDVLSTVPSDVSVIVEGLRHQAVLDVLVSAAAPRVVSLVHVRISHGLFIKRALDAGRSHDEAAAVWGDQSEQDVDGRLQAAAAIRLTGDRSVAQNVTQVLEQLQ